MPKPNDKGTPDEDGNVAPNTLESAAHEAAMADGLIPVDPATEMKMKKAGLRRGKWTTEEESYANRLIYEFKLGLLPLTDGTTLRTFLSKLLNCDPMRISKKFVGQNCIGKVCINLNYCIKIILTVSLVLLWFFVIPIASIPSPSTGPGQTNSRTNRE
jgi:hypothetical protein